MQGDTLSVLHAKRHSQACSPCADAFWQLHSVCDAFFWHGFDALNPLESKANASKYNDILRDYVPVVKVLETFTFKNINSKLLLSTDLD